MIHNDDRPVVTVSIHTYSPEKYVLYDTETGERWTPTGPNHTWVAYHGEDAVTQLQKSLAKAWGYVLDGLLDETFDDGTPMLPYILKTNPELAERLWEAFKPKNVDLLRHTDGTPVDVSKPGIGYLRLDVD